MRMQLRMLEIRNELGMLENATMRKTYEDVYFKAKSNGAVTTGNGQQKSNVHIVTMADTITKQMEYFETVKKLIAAHDLVKCSPSLMVTHHSY